MAVQRVRTKIMLAAFVIIFFTMTLSSVIISFIIYGQNRDVSFQLLNQSMNIVRDDIVATEAKLLAQSRQASTSNEIGLNLEWVSTTSYEDGVLMGMENNLKNMMKGFYNIGLAANIWQTMIYKMDGSLVGFVVIDETVKMVGFPRTDDYFVAKLADGESIVEETWNETKTVEGVVSAYDGITPEQETISFQKIGDYICLVARIPVITSVIDSDSGDLKDGQVGFITATYKLNQAFVERMERITGNRIGIIEAQGKIIGKLEGYQTLAVDSFGSPQETWQLQEQKTFMNTTEMGQEVYFQSALPIFSQSEYLGAVVALYSQESAMKNTWAIISILILVSLGCLVIVLPMSLLFSNSFSKPLEELSSILETVEESGDFSQRVIIRSQDEIGRTSKAFNRLMNTLQKVIRSVSSVLAEVSEGDLSQQITESFHGDLQELKNNTNNSIEVLAQTISQVIDVSQSVYEGSVELATSSQALADGTIQQAATLEEISASMNEIEQRTKDNSENATETQRLTNQSIQVVENGSSQMENMLVSMNRINESSSEVAKVVKVIDEIAFQTNLLALNAAVEAARAGKFGKGFAVVAEEVRNLAARSAEAAKNTTELIESSLKEVGRGVQNTDSTATVLKEIATGINQSNELVNGISEASQYQANSVKEINNGLSNVNSLVQENSSISEQSAAASEELTQQANQLKELMNGFRLTLNKE